MNLIDKISIATFLAACVIAFVENKETWIIIAVLILIFREVRNLRSIWQNKYNYKGV